MEQLMEEVNPNSPPATEQPGLCMKPQVTARHGGKGDRGSWHGAGGRGPGVRAGPATVPRWSPPSPTPRAQRQGRAPHRSWCTPSRHPGWLEALREQGQGAVGGSELAGPQAVEWDLARKERGRKAYVGRELAQWGKESGQELKQWEYERYRELSQWGDVRVQGLFPWEYEGHKDPSSWGNESVQELDQVEYERYQEPSHWEGMGVQKLFPWEYEGHKEPSRWADERVQELDQLEYERYQEPSQWGNENVQVLDQLEYERYQKPSGWGNENVQKLREWEYDRYKKSSQWGDVRVQELFPWEYEGHKKPSQWQNESAQNLYQWEYEKYPELSQWDSSTDQELYKEEVRQDTELSQRGHGRDIEELQKGGEEITITTIWINPKYAQFLQDPDAAPQDSAKAAEAQGQGPPDPSAPQVGAQPLREQPAPPKKRPSRFRRALRALLCWPCLRAQLDSQCPLPEPGPAPQAQSLPGVTRAAFDVQGSGTPVPCQENDLAEA